jgi:antitoxin VapB
MMEGQVSVKTAKLFMNGGSQAVRLPAEFRFNDVDEVSVRRDAVTGDLILSARRGRLAWKDFFALRDRAEAPADFMSERPLNRAMQPRPLESDR